MNSANRNASFYVITWRCGSGYNTEICRGVVDSCTVVLSAIVEVDTVVVVRSAADRQATKINVISRGCIIYSSTTDKV